MKKRLFKFLTAALAAVMTVSTLGLFGGCGPVIKRSANTIYVRAYEGGYGDAWLREIVKKFNEQYADEGYKVSLLAPQGTLAGDVVGNQMSGKEWADVYYAGNTSINRLVNDNLVMDITETVLDKPAINFDGTVESKKIIEKEALDYDSDIDEINGKRYSLHGAQSVGGLLVNTSKLYSYEDASGNPLEIPRTSNEMINCFDVILAQSAATGQKPIGYINSNNGYSAHFYNTWAAQYEGGDWWENQFWAYADADGNDLDMAGAKALFEADGLEYAMTEVYRTYDLKYSSGSDNLNLAHTALMARSYGTVFMADGEWAYNEIAQAQKNTTYYTPLAGLTYINIPVISALGVKLFGTGTTYNLDDAKCDEVLSLLVKCADDERLSLTDAAAAVQAELGVALQEADVQAVYEARGVYTDRNMGSGMWWICKKTQNAEICELFLRAVASEDAAVIMAEKANMASFYTDNLNSLGDAQYWQSIRNIYSNPYKYGIAKIARGQRSEKPGTGHGITFKTLNAEFCVSIIQEGVTAFNGNNVKTNPGIYAQKAAAKIATELSYDWTNIWN